MLRLIINESVGYAAVINYVPAEKGLKGSDESENYGNDLN